MPPKAAAEKKPATKAPATKAPAEKKEAGKKTAAAGDKKKRSKSRKETYSSYIYKGMISAPFSPRPSSRVAFVLETSCRVHNLAVPSSINSNFTLRLGVASFVSFPFLLLGP